MEGRDERKKETTQLLGGGCAEPERKQPPNRVHHLDSQIKGEAGRPQGNPASFCRQSEKGGVAGRRPTPPPACLLSTTSVLFPLLEGCPEVPGACWGRGGKVCCRRWGWGGRWGFSLLCFLQVSSALCLVRTEFPTKKNQGREDACLEVMSVGAGRWRVGGRRSYTGGGGDGGGILSLKQQQKDKTRQNKTTKDLNWKGIGGTCL